jgi:riboflavin kinase / FMN adenylyltransferase
MIDLRWTDLTERRISNAPVCLTIGVFDGVHRGHRELIRRVTECDEAIAAVITFDRHPQETLRPERFRGYLMTPRQKRSALEQLGIRLVVGIDFSYQFSKMSGTDFFQRLVRSFSVQRVVVGHDFACGRDMSMTADDIGVLLEPEGVEVIVLEPVKEAGAVLSSSMIRGLVEQGRLKDARRLLSSAYELDVCEHNRRIGLEQRSRSVITACGQLVPPAGRYVGYVRNGEAGHPTEIRVSASAVEWDEPADGDTLYIGLEEKTE